MHFEWKWTRNSFSSMLFGGVMLCFGRIHHTNDKWFGLIFRLGRVDGIKIFRGIFSRVFEQHVSTTWMLGHELGYIKHFTINNDPHRAFGIIVLGHLFHGVQLWISFIASRHFEDWLQRYEHLKFSFQNLGQIKWHSVIIAIDSLIWTFLFLIYFASLT